MFVVMTLTSHQELYLTLWPIVCDKSEAGINSVCSTVKGKSGEELKKELIASMK
jgi:hypothetical protein